MFHMFRIVRQYDSVDCALACLKMIANIIRCTGHPFLYGAYWNLISS